MPAATLQHHIASNAVNELITSTEFGSNGNGISCECVDLSIESMEVRGKSNHEHVAGRVSAFADTTFTRSEHKGSIVESDECRIESSDGKGRRQSIAMIVHEGKLLSDTRHSQGGTVTKGDEHDNVKLGRVIHVALHSHDCVGCAEGCTRHRSTARQGVNTDSTMNSSADEMIAQEQVEMSSSSSRNDSVLEHDCRLVVLYTVQ
eukprot:scaffold4191_cov76-Skeletonema_dohrnii-CCMP3373.AAC.5